MIPKETWKQFAKPSHFICSEHCRFGRSTVIGDVVVSTVGDYHPPAIPGTRFNGSQEIIGYYRFYETMVFHYTWFCRREGCQCGGIPNIDPHDLDFQGYMTEAEADAGHEAMYLTWAAKARPS